MKEFMKLNLVVATLCSFLISCATSNPGEQPPPLEGAVVSPVSIDGGLPEGSADGGATAQALNQTQAAGDFPVDSTPNEFTPGTEQVSVDGGVEAQPEAQAEAPSLKPVHPVTSWTPERTAVSEPVPAATYYGSEPKSSKSSKSSKVSKAAKNKKAAALKKQSRKSAQAKHSGKKSSNKKIAKKPSKAECKKLAKNAKKNKKQLAMCKVDKKKTAGKAKKNGRVAKG